MRSRLEAPIAFREREVQRLESVLAAAVLAAEATRTTAGSLVSLPGGGTRTAHRRAIARPELGRKEATPIALLAGVAPPPEESGRDRGRASLRGGRPRVRAKLSRAAFKARTSHPVIGSFSARRVTRGKTFKPARTACLRKRLVLRNPLVARGELWDPSHAP